MQPCCIAAKICRIRDYMLQVLTVGKGEAAGSLRLAVDNAQSTQAGYLRPVHVDSLPIGVIETLFRFSRLSGNMQTTLAF
jgi:hypothetical protein